MLRSIAVPSIKDWSIDPELVDLDEADIDGRRSQAVFPQVLRCIPYSMVAKARADNPSKVGHSSWKC